MPGFAKTVIASTLLINMGRFSVFTFLAVYLTQHLNMASWAAGTILTITLVFHQVVPVFSGVISDRIGYSRMLISGCFFSFLGYFGIYYFDQFIHFIIPAFFVGLGAAFYEPSIKSIIGNLPLAFRRNGFTYFNQALNAGAVVGAVLGGVMVIFNSALPILLGSLTFLLITIILLFVLKDIPAGNHTFKVKDSYMKVLKNKNFMAFSGAMIFFWMLYTQLTISLPLDMYRVSGSEQNASLVIIVNGLYGFFIMFLLRKMFTGARSAFVVKAGLMIMGVGLLCVPLIPSIIWLVFCVLLFTTGETFVLPGADIAIAEFSSYEDTGAFYGMFGISYAIGGSAGNYLGTWLMASFGGTSLPWLIYAGIGSIGFIFMHLIDRKHSADKDASVST